MNGSLRFENVTRRFGATTAVDGVTLEIAGGEAFALLGPSGCGKTTLLRMAAGFERPDEGRIFLDGIDITELPPNRRPVNTVFQSYALFPHLSVRQNIAFGPKVSGWSPDRIRAEVDRMLSMVDLQAHADKSPGQLSGGQKQRVAIARALVNEPKVLLLDEPLAALDLKLRQRMLLELEAIHRKTQTTFIYVTHDQSEAMSISDRIAVMNRGRIEQTGTPVEIYEAPRNSFVAGFIGDSNFLEGEIVEHSADGVSLCRVDGLGTMRIHRRGLIPSDHLVRLSLRPEKILLSRDLCAQPDQLNRFVGEVEDVMYLGAGTRYRVRCGEMLICVDMSQRHHPDEQTPLRSGDNVQLLWHPRDAYLLERHEPAEDRLLESPDPT